MKVPEAVARWYDRHARTYSRDHPGLPGEAAFYATLARRLPPPALELGCGSGRVTRAIAAAGVPVVGLDISAAMLRRARSTCQEVGAAPLDLVHADMRCFAVKMRFGLICIPYRGFAHLLADGDRRAALACARAHLRPDGLLALNLAKPEPLDVLATRFSGSERRGRRTGTGGPPAAPLRVAAVRGLLEAAGFEVHALFGGFDGRPFTPDCTEHVWLARPCAAVTLPKA